MIKTVRENKKWRIVFNGKDLDDVGREKIYQLIDELPV